MCVTQTQHVENGRCEFIEGEWSRGSEYVSTACLRACLIQEDFISRVAVDAAGFVSGSSPGGSIFLCGLHVARVSFGYMCEICAGAERNARKANYPGQITNNLSVMISFRPSREGRKHIISAQRCLIAIAIVHDNA